VPFDMDGRLPLAALAPRLVEARPPRFETPRGSSEGAAAASRPIELDAESEAVIVERLRALGYVE
ncbi:MAG: hypothetical protein KGJ86_19050, partial [Chloroflexota bacterium]|nr:hypothetical protein [Chloroflexota bacterium]